jgi:hypothetical protein
MLIGSAEELAAPEGFVRDHTPEEVSLLWINKIDGLGTSSVAPLTTGSHHQDDWEGEGD